MQDWLEQGTGYKEPLCYFSQLRVNLPLSQSKKFSLKLFQVHNRQQCVIWSCRTSLNPAACPFTGSLSSNKSASFFFFNYKVQGHPQRGRHSGAEHSAVFSKLLNLETILGSKLWIVFFCAQSCLPCLSRAHGHHSVLCVVHKVPEPKSHSLAKLTSLPHPHLLHVLLLSSPTEAPCPPQGATKQGCLLSLPLF